MFRKAALFRKIVAFSYSAVARLAGTPAFAEDGFFKGHEVKLIVGAGAGGAP